MRIRAGALLWLATGACGDAASGRGAPIWQPGADEGDGEAGAADTLDVDPIDSTTGDVIEEGGGGDEGFACDGEDVQACMCPDGPGDGVQSCLEGMWGPCLCDDGSTGAGDDGSSGDAPADGGAEADSGAMEPPATEVCFPGDDGLYTTCLALHAFDPDAPPEGYAYPEALGGDPNYRRPIALLDLDAEDPALALAPNFTLGELAQASKGRWGIVQPHAVESLQALRDALGPLAVNSGYRSPAYNAGVDGATYSRHMYGDGFDLDPVDVSLATLEVACGEYGGMLVEYETHVHCDWRFDDVDEGFFGPPDAAAIAPPPYAGAVHHHGRVLWSSDDGFDEGEPVRRWTAYDAGGAVIAAARGPWFTAPPGAVRVTVRIGAVLEREQWLAAP